MKTSPPSDVTCISNRSSKSTVVDDQGGKSTNSECEYDTNHEWEDNNGFQCSSIPAPANTHLNKLAMLGNMYTTLVASKVAVAPKSKYYTHTSNCTHYPHSHPCHINLISPCFPSTSPCITFVVYPIDFPHIEAIPRPIFLRKQMDPVPTHW